MASQIEIIKAYRIPIRGRMGQHLLIDPNTQRRITALTGAREGSGVVEIGPGLGALTGPLLETGAHVTAVEKDKRFVEVLRDRFGGTFADRFKLVHADALETDLGRLPVDQAAVRPWKLVSNLPYYITAPLLFHVLTFRHLFPEAVFMMQKEVAERLMAEPGSKAYGRLTLAFRLFAQVEHAFDVSRNCFIPKPAVDSSVVRVRFHGGPEAAGAVDGEAMLRFFALAFSQRRKQLLPLLARHPDMPDRRALQAIFNRAGIPAGARAEELLLKDFMALARGLRKRPED